MLETTKTTLEVFGATLALLAAFWAALRLIHRYFERFLFFSGCHLIPLTLREDIQKRNPQFKEKLEDHAFQPFIVLPRKFNNYFKVKDGGRVILRFKPPDGAELVVSATAFWYPEAPDLWDLFDQPALSLVLRRYFGIERPLLGHEDAVPRGWQMVEHGTTRNGKQDMALLHRTSEKSGHLIWLDSVKYSARFWLPQKGAKGAAYQSKWQDGWFLEYAGISLKVAKPSILSIKS
ncbi:MAG: hypothetical protein BBJ57_05775 [Desulfobacterales bacterium PC51MH44]|nr:MAG: hypothetical protein BBJ57_05775 [Desulfobacterales bacterium PC51MH44]